MTNLSDRHAYYKGYHFDGWDLEPTYQTKVEVINPEDYLCDLNLYGKYSPAVYTVTYNLDGGINHPDNPTEFTVLDGNITLKAPTREGYDFAGWQGGFYNDTHYDYVFMIEPEQANSYKLKATWVPSSDNPDCFVLFRLDGNGYFDSGENSISYTKGSGDIYLPEPKREGYIFGGWYTSTSFKYKVDYIPEGYFGKWNLRPLWIPVS